VGRPRTPGFPTRKSWSASSLSTWSEPAKNAGLLTRLTDDRPLESEVLTRLARDRRRVADVLTRFGDDRTPVGGYRDTRPLGQDSRPMGHVIRPVGPLTKFAGPATHESSAAGFTQCRRKYSRMRVNTESIRRCAKESRNTSHAASASLWSPQLFRTG